MSRLKPGEAFITVHLLMLALVVVPFYFYEGLFDQIAAELLSGSREPEIFFGTVFLLAVDVFAPVPSSTVSIGSGILLGAPMAFVASLAGLTVGCLIGYGFGYHFRRLHFDRWYSDSEYRHLSGELSRFGVVVLLICRGVPILAEMSVMVAGFHRYPFIKFMAATFAGNCVLASAYSVLGEAAAEVSSAYMLAAVFILIPVITSCTRIWWLKKTGNLPVSD